jgi:hypothetical protein
MTTSVTCRLLGVGAMSSPRFLPAGLVVEHEKARIMIDGGPGAEPRRRIDAWLVSDPRAELIRQIRAIGRRWGVEPRVAAFRAGDFSAEPKRVVHTSHETYGYLVRAGALRIAWAPEFYAFPRWAHDLDLMFAEAAGFARPVRFAHDAGGHMATLDVSRAALRQHVSRLVFAHIGRPSIRAIDAGQAPPFGQWGVEGRAYRVAPASGRHGVGA